MENAELSGPDALLFLQLLIALITKSAVNVCAISIGFLFVSLVTNRVSLEEVCLPRFEVLTCWLHLTASCLDDENEILLGVSFADVVSPGHHCDAYLKILFENILLYILNITIVWLLGLVLCRVQTHTVVGVDDDSII